MIKKSIIFHLYTLAWCLNEVLTALKQNANLLLFILIFISVCNAVYVNLYYKTNLFIKSLNVLLVVFTVYGVLAILGSDVILRPTGDVVPNYAYLGDIYSSLLPIYSYYLYAVKGYINTKCILIYSILFVVVCAACFHIAYFNFTIETFREEGFTNNAGKTFVYVIPLFFFLDRYKKSQYVLLFISFLYILFSLKRGTILAGALLVFVFIYKAFHNYTKKEKIIMLTFLLLCAIVGLGYLNETLFQSDYFQSRLESTLEGDSSGRDLIYNELYDIFLNDISGLAILFGNGANATIRLIGIEAHNDWLEILINNGILGFLVYFCFFISFVVVWKRSRLLHDLSIYNVLGAYLIVMFLFSMYSMSYYTLFTSGCLGIGYCLAKYDYKCLIMKHS